MTISELYSQVAQLGFEDALENEDRFYFAVNRALLQANTVRPATTSLIVDHNPLKNLISKSSFNPIARVDDITFEAENAKAYYFEADGIGMLYVEKYNKESNTWSILSAKQLTARKNFVAYSDFIKDLNGFVSGRVRLRFSGEYIYSVRNVALYRYLYSDDKADIPAYEPYTRYDFKTLVDDFLGFADPPFLESEELVQLNQDYRVEGESILLLPYNNAGVYKVMYKRRPKSIVNIGAAATDETVIDLDPELSHALSNLVAAYIWAEDEPSLAEYYLSLYRERVAEIRATTKNVAPIIYRNSNGW